MEWPNHRYVFASIRVGPAPFREYHDGLHPFSWRSWRHFGTGTIGDMACHHVAVPFMALRLWEVKQFIVEHAG